jgi:mono/diheme cytochrome c family protein
VGVSVASNNVFPGRVSPGINRGYTAIMSLDGYLKTVTAACGPVIYRGDKYPAEYYGNAFVCEPSANLISRQILNEDGIKVKGTGALNDKIDFLCSTDERFRPVNMFNAPDGTIYILDLYHGILQHKAYLSAYLKDQIKKRDLDKNNLEGRIWRLVHESAKPGPAPKLSTASAEELVKTLSNPSGWWRDTAQRLLVEKQDKAAVPLLEKVISGEAPETTPLGKIHALWVLHGMDKLTDRVASAAAADADPRVRLQALRTGETLVIKNTGPNMINAALALAKDPDPKIQLQVLFMASPANPKLQEAGTAILSRSLSEPIFRSAALNGAAGRELELLQNLLNDATFKGADPAGQKVMLNDLAECVIRARVSERVDKLFDLISQQEGNKDVVHALLQGTIDALLPDPKSKSVPRKLRLLKEPTGIAKLTGSSDKKTVELTNKAQAAMTWPNKPGDTTPPLKPLNADQEKRFAMGKMMYTAICASCHQPSGLGQEGTAPALVDSEWVLGNEDRLARIILCGVRGPIRVGKKTVDLDMPNLRMLNDEQISGILTYIRREWGHEGNPVEPESVAKSRAETATRGDQYTAEELLKIGK